MHHRELLAVQEHLHRSSNTSNNNHDILLRCKQLVQTVERVILKLDEALLEARLARDAMLLYIQVSKMHAGVCPFLSFTIGITYITLYFFI